MHELSGGVLQERNLMQLRTWTLGTSNEFKHEQLAVLTDDDDAVDANGVGSVVILATNAKPTLSIGQSLDAAQLLVAIAKSLRHLNLTTRNYKALGHA